MSSHAFRLFRLIRAHPTLISRQSPDAPTLFAELPASARARCCADGCLLGLTLEEYLDIKSGLNHAATVQSGGLPATIASRQSRSGTSGEKYKLTVTASVLWNQEGLPYHSLNDRATRVKPKYKVTGTPKSSNWFSQIRRTHEAERLAVSLEKFLRHQQTEPRECTERERLLLDKERLFLPCIPQLSAHLAIKAWEYVTDLLSADVSDSAFGECEVWVTPECTLKKEDYRTGELDHTQLRQSWDAWAQTLSVNHIGDFPLKVIRRQQDGEGGS